MSDFNLKDEAEDILRQFNFDPSDKQNVYVRILEDYGLDISKLESEMINYQNKTILGFQKINDDAITPKYNYPEDSGFDLHSIEDLDLKPFERKLVKTGLKLNIPDGNEIQIRSKSGLALNQGLIVLNSPGTIDRNYKGEICVIVMNMNNHDVKINKGNKVGQAVLCPVVAGKWLKVVNELVETNSSDRKDKGFGSTGI